MSNRETRRVVSDEERRLGRVIVGCSVLPVLVLFVLVVAFLAVAFGS